MGYYASIDVNVCIKAENINKCRAAVLAFQALGPHSFDSLKEDGELDRWFGEHLHDCEIEWCEPEPLKQLALAGSSEHTRGDLSIYGGTHQKWRSYLEDMFDAVAPFVTPESTIHITGEEHEQVIYRFEDGVRTEDWGRMTFGAERQRTRQITSCVAEISKVVASGGSMHLVKAILRGYAEVLQKEEIEY